MNTNRLSLTLAAALALGLASCSKNEPAIPTAQDANKAPVSAADAAAKTAEAAKAETAKAAEAAKIEAARVADVAKTEAAKVAESAKAEAAKVEAAKTAEATQAADDAKTQGLIDQAKSLIAEGKFSEATSALQQLAGQSLSADQQKLVDGLKDQIQTALAARAAENAAGDVGYLLKK
jgi:hypothetical protein